MSYIILNGNDSREIKGLLIQQLPPITKPAMRVEVEEIDGRDGDITTPLGFAAYDKTLTIGLYGNYDIDAIIEYFNSSGTVTFSNEPDKAYSFEITAQIDFERLLRFRTADVTFHVQPFKFSTAEKPITFTPTVTSGQGTSVTLTPTVAGETLDAISFYGNTQQGSTPTPSAPIPVNNVTGTTHVEFYNADQTQESTVALRMSQLELCKIGSYQDYIYYTNDNWVKHTAIKKFTVDASQVTLQNYSNVTYAVIPTPSNALCYGNYKDIPCVCTHAAYSYGLSEGWNTVNAVNKIFCQADANSFWLGFAAGTTLAQVQAVLSTCTIYYVLLNRLDVPLASASLQNQLTSLLGIGLYNGSTIITTDNSTPPTIKATATMEAFSVVNTGNVYARPKITITGTGTVTVSVNMQQIFTIALQGNITIDGALMEAYQDTTDNLQNRSVTGNYDNFILPVGTNVIELSGDITQVTVENYSRWL